MNDGKSVCIKMHKINEEALVLNMTFLRLHLYQIWKQKFPKFAKSYFQLESKEDPLTNLAVLGVRAVVAVSHRSSSRNRGCSCTSIIRMAISGSHQ